MSTIDRAQAIGKTGDPFWVEVIKAYENVSIFKDITFTVERGDKAADVYYAQDVGDGDAVVITVRPLSGSEMTTTKIESNGGYR